MDEARAYGIPIICVVDADKQLVREVIDCYMEKGLGWLFDAQIISHTVQSRDHAIDLMISAIRRAIQHCHTHDTTIKAKKATPAAKQEQRPAPPHEDRAARSRRSVTRARVVVVCVCAACANVAVARSRWPAQPAHERLSKLSAHWSVV